MTMTELIEMYREVWVEDTEFGAAPGEPPEPRCLVATELKSGRVVELWLDGRDRPPRLPYAINDRTLVVVFVAQAEWGVHLKLGWGLPRRVIDLHAEFRCLTNGVQLPTKSLIGALQFFGLPAMESTAKEGMRGLALRGGPYTPDERRELVRYCRADVEATANLLRCMLPRINLTAALVRGRYGHAVAKMAAEGVPIDVRTWRRLGANWDAIKSLLVRRVNPRYGIYVPVSPSHPEGPFRFDQARFEAWVASRRLPWPKTPTGQLSVADKVFKAMAEIWGGEVNELRELRNSLGDFKLVSLAVGADGRNRVMLWPFSTKTCRNAPSNAEYVFGATKWVRSLIKPPKGHAIAYIDWAKQEPGIASVLSGDEALRQAYKGEDLYLATAKACGMAPKHATKESHKSVRNAFKTVVLATMYGMTSRGLATKLGIAPVYADTFLESHRLAFPRFWEWADQSVANALAGRFMRTAFGWDRHLGVGVNSRSVRNWPIQSTGSHLMQYAAMYATEAGLGVGGPIHDAFLLVAPMDRIDADVALMRRCMDRASRLVLDGFTLKTDVQVVRWPHRYVDEDGAETWRIVRELLAEVTTARRRDRVAVSP